jgi:protease YdgD
MMRSWIAALAVAWTGLVPGPGAIAQDRLSSETIGRVLAQTKPAPPFRYRGDDSCALANDRVCNEPGFGAGGCETGTDRSDCWRIMEDREDDSCEYAADGECDEPDFGSGACTMGTDVTDCGNVSALRFQTDSCRHAFNGVCEAREDGEGACARRTDRSDCVGRERPLRLYDHFFGRDDRVLPDPSTEPWRAVGEYSADDGSSCTATLVADAVVATAAHCIIGDDGQVAASGRFRLADRSAEARVVDYLMDPAFDSEAFGGGDSLDGLDWALLRLDRPLGANGRHIVPAAADRARPLVQGGYSWDTDPHLSAHEGCELRTLYEDNTFAHACDTTRGDSGSPFLQRRAGRWVLVGTDSNFRQNDGGQVIYIAAQAAGWMNRVAPFAAGEIGAGGLRPQAGGKPVAPPRKPG